MARNQSCSKQFSCATSRIVRRDLHFEQFKSEGTLWGGAEAADVW